MNYNITNFQLGKKRYSDEMIDEVRHQIVNELTLRLF